jgi:hypothetical protein
MEPCADAACHAITPHLRRLLDGCKQDASIILAEFEKVADEDLDSWGRLSANAVRASLAGTTAPANPDALPTALRAIEAQLPKDQVDRFRRALDAGLSLEDGEACWAMKTIMKGVAGMEPIARQAALRALAAL